MLWSWAAEVISLCPFSIQDLAFNSFVNKPPRSAHGHVMECSYYYNKQDRIFGSLRVWFHLVSEISGVNQRYPVTAALLFLILKSFPKEEKNIAFKTDESNIFKQHLHFLRPLCLLFINWSVCHVLECCPLPCSSGCQHCYKQIITKYKKFLFWSVAVCPNIFSWFQKVTFL